MKCEDCERAEAEIARLRSLKSKTFMQVADQNKSLVKAYHEERDRRAAAEAKVRSLEVELMKARGMKVFYVDDVKEAVLGDTACHSPEHAVPETASNDEQRD